MREPRDTTLDDDVAEPVGKGRRRSPPRATLGDAWRETKLRVLIAGGGVAIVAFGVASVQLNSCATRLEAERATANAKTTGLELDATYDVSRKLDAKTAEAIAVITVRLEREEARADMLERLVLSLLTPAQRRRYQPPPKPTAEVPVAAVQAPTPATPEAAAAAAKENP